MSFRFGRLAFILGHLVMMLPLCCGQCAGEFANQVIWPLTPDSSERRIASSPWCLNSTFQLETRQCLNAEWQPTEAPACPHTQPPFAAADNCPAGLTMLRAAGPDADDYHLCASLEVHSTSEQPNWHADSARCAQLGSQRTLLDLPADDWRLVRQFVQQRAGNTPIWLPARWYEPNRLRWHLPGAAGRIDQLNATRVGQAAGPGPGCATLRFAAVVNAEPQYVKRDCDVHQLPMLCVYAEPQPLLRLACPADRWTTRYAEQQRLCYGIADAEEPESPAGRLALQDWEFVMKVTNVQETLIVRELHQLRMASAEQPVWCVFDALPDAENRTVPLDLDEWQKAATGWQGLYVNWNDQTAFPEEGMSFSLYLVQDVEAEWSLNSRHTCTLVASELQAVIPELWLRFAVESVDRLQLDVYNPLQLWSDQEVQDDVRGISCFYADEDNANVRNTSVHRNSPSTEDSPTLQPGTYWCEGYAIGSMQLVSTPRFHIDHLDYFVGSVWVQISFGNTTLDLPEWLRMAVLATNQQDYIYISEVDVRRVTHEQYHSAHFLRLEFRLAVRFITGTPYEPAEELLQFTDYNILKVAAKYEATLRVLQVIPFYFAALNSTEFCMREIQSTQNVTLWPGARIGETRTSIAICLVAVGQPIMRRCEGGSEAGAQWLDLSRRPCMSTVIAEVTQELHDISTTFLERSQTGDLLARVRELTDSQPLTPFDVVSVGNIMFRAAQLNQNYALSGAMIEDLLQTYEELMEMDAVDTQLAAQLNATNLLLGALDSVLGNLMPEDLGRVAGIGRLDNSSEHKHLQVHLLDPSSPDEPRSGIAMHWGGQIEYLLANQSVEDLLNWPTLEVAAFLPAELLEQLPPLSRLVVCVFDNDVLFQTPAETIHVPHQLFSHIISVSIPWVNTTQLPVPMPLFFRRNEHTDAEITERNWLISGGFWSLDNRRIWPTQGVNRVQNSSYVVQYNASHLTNFALIIRDQLCFSPQDSANLFIITLVGSIASLVGIVGIFLTALSFSTWRRKSSNQLLLQLSAAIAAMLVLFMFVDNSAAVRNWEVCVVMGAVMHYLVLVTFVWMLVMAYLQFMRYVVVFVQMRSDRYVLKMSVFSWTVPLVPVTVVLLVDPDLYVPPAVVEELLGAAEEKESGNMGMCYPTGYAMYLGLMAPIGLIVLCNVLVFVMVIYNLLQVQTTNRSIVIAQLRVSTFLFFLLGLTWIFGFMVHSDGPSVLFAYLFCATATLQGLVLFVYFVVLEPGTRTMWLDAMRTVCGIKRRGSMTLEVNA